MNEKQKSYAMKRVDEIAKAFIKASEDKNIVVTKAVSIDDENVEALLKKGKFKIDIDHTRGHYGNIGHSSQLRSFILFPGEVRGKTDRSKHEAVVVKVNAYATKVRDQIMLGDGNSAMAMLVQFGKEKF